VKIFFYSTSEFGSEFFYVLYLRFKTWVIDESFFCVDTTFRVELSESFTKVFLDKCGFYRVYIQAHIKFDVPVNDRREPVSFEKIWIGIDKKSLHIGIIDTKFIYLYFEKSRGYKVFYIGKSLFVVFFGLKYLFFLLF